MTTDPLIPILISSTALITLFAVYFIIFLIVHKNKQRQNIVEKERLKHQYESQLLNSRLEIQEETLNRVSMEIHDNICQELGVVKQQMSKMIHNPEQIGMLGDVSHSLSESISRLRNVSHALNTDRIQNLGLYAAIEEEIKFQRTIYPLSFQLDVQGENDSLPGNTELFLFRVMQEAISNSIKHGDASAIHIFINYAPEKFEMNIKDNGSGFDTSHQDATKGIGLLNMKQRIQLIKGSLNITSAPQQGTEIKIVINHNNVTV